MVVRKTLAIGLAVAVVVVGGASAGAWYYFSKKDTANASAASAANAHTNAGPSAKMTGTGAKGTSGTSPTSGTSNTAKTPGDHAPSPAPSGNQEIEIAASGFSPKDFTVHKGASVTWTNKDTVNHALASDETAGGPRSPQLKPNDSYTFTFNTMGTFHYHCVLVPGLTGTVTVVE